MPSARRAARTEQAIGVSSWPEAPGILALTPEDVHVWGVSLDATASALDRFRWVLGPEERARAGRFVFDADRNHFITAHGVLRTILGRYLRRGAAELRFMSGSHGKPVLQEGDDIRFNLSHSGDYALIAVSRGREVGVDIECARRDNSNAEVARRFFSAREVAALEMLPESERARAFFDCWARKEAYVKARGEGLSVPLDRFSVSVAPREPAAFVEFEGGPAESERWSLRELSVGPDYAAAVVVEGLGWTLQEWRFTP